MKLDYYEIEKELYRLEVCAWAYGWSKEYFFAKAREMISEMSFHNAIVRNTPPDPEELVFLISSKFREQDMFNIEYIPKHRSYGGKYIKRSQRY